MSTLFYGGISLLSLFGFMAGYFVVLPAMIAISATSTVGIVIVICIYMQKTYKETVGPATLFFICFAIVSNIAVWVIYYDLTDQVWVGEFFRTHIIR